MPAELLARVSDQRGLGLGDALLDGWGTGRPSPLCRGGPGPVVDVDGTRYAPGGAGNTAVNVAALGGQVTLVAAVGPDDAGHRLRQGLTAVVPHLVVVPGRSTPVKRRLLADGQVLARLDEGDTDPLPAAAAWRLIELADREIHRHDALIVCDYGAGTLTGPVRDWLAEVRQRLPLLVVDAHDARGWADLAPDLVTPNFTEAAEAIDTGPVPRQRDRWGAEHAEELTAALPAGTVAVTLHADGAGLVERGVRTARTPSRPVPASRTTGAEHCYDAS